MNKIVIISTVLLCCSVVSIAQSKGNMLKQTDEKVNFRESPSNSKSYNEQQFKKNENATCKNQAIGDPNKNKQFNSFRSPKGSDRINFNLKEQQLRPHELRHSKNIIAIE